MTTFEESRIPTDHLLPLDLVQTISMLLVPNLRCMRHYSAYLYGVEGAWRN